MVKRTFNLEGNPWNHLKSCLKVCHGNKNKGIIGFKNIVAYF